MTQPATPPQVRSAGLDHDRVLFREMLRIRRFEEKCAELYSAGKIRGFCICTSAKRRWRSARSRRSRTMTRLSRPTASTAMHWRAAFPSMRSWRRCTASDRGAATDAADAEAGVQHPAERAGMRAAIAAAMARAKRDIPHYYLSTTIDMTAAERWLRRENETRAMADRLLMVGPLLKAVATALRDVPELNGHWIDGAFCAGAGIHIGVAIALHGGGLVAPAIHDADRKDVGTLMREVTDLVSRARTGSLRSSELTDATMTVTSLGEQGVDAAFGIIYPPQVASSDSAGSRIGRGSSPEPSSRGP